MQKDIASTQRKKVGPLARIRASNLRPIYNAMQVHWNQNLLLYVKEMFLQA